MKEARRDGTGSKGGQTSGKTTGSVSKAAALPRIVDLGRGKCIPCKMMAPILEELKQEYAERFAVDVIDVGENPTAATEYGIRMIPTQIFIDADGNELFRHEGFMSKEDILAKWNELEIDVKLKDS
ncbi:MAG: thioredoxin family protein [Candidatus Eiseniibacteriota bacterium]|nr:MAG: thioredoxin family protein [Candidatus Eisenbacteria bacterium]